MSKTKPLPSSGSTLLLNPRVEIQTSASVSQKPPGKAELQTLEWSRMEHAADMVRSELPQAGGKASLKIQVVIKPTAYPGDADAIEMDLQSRPRAVLVSLENLKSGAGYSWELPSDFLKTAKAEKTFEVPVSEKPEQFGLFLCTAPKEEKNCHNKPYKDINKIFLEHIRKDTGPASKIGPFSFNTFSWITGESQAFGTPAQGESQFVNLKKYLEARGILKEDQLDSAKKLTHTLGSLPLKLSSSGVSIELPHFSARNDLGGIKK